MGCSARAGFRRSAVVSVSVSIALASIAAAQAGSGGGPRTLHETVSVAELRVPQKAREQLSKALACFARHDDTGALQHANATLAIAPDLPNALTLRGYLELRGGAFDASREDFEHALRSDPGFRLANLYLGAALNRLGRFEEAQASLERHAEFDPRSWENAYEMSKSWMGLHDYAHMLQAINQSSDLGGDAQIGPSLHFLRGRALAGLKQYTAARRELHVFLVAQSSGTLSELARELLTSIDQEDTLAVSGSVGPATK